MQLEELKDIEPAAILENENWWDGYEPEETDWLLETVDCTTLNPTEAFVKLYSAEQMQEYAKEKVLKAMERLTFKRDGNMAKEILGKLFKEAQDEEV